MASLAAAPAYMGLRCPCLARSTPWSTVTRRKLQDMPAATDVMRMTRTSARHLHNSRKTLARHQQSNIVTSLAQESPAQPVYEAPSIHRTLKPSVLRPLLFTLATGVTAYGLAAWYTNVDTKKQEEKLKGSTPSIFRRASSSVELAMARRTELLTDAKAFLVRRLGSQPDMKSFQTRMYTMTTEWWINKTEAQRTCLGLIGLQGIIFIGWKIRPAFFSKAFTHYPLSGRSYTLLTSTFSHSSGFHFLFNSVAFYSFGPGAMSFLWEPTRDPASGLKESTSRYHFLALFVTAGVISSFCSHAYSLLYMLPRALKMGSRSAAAVLPSLGASGSIYATVVMTALAFPHSQVSLIFFPFASFPIGNGVAGLILFDVIGLLSTRFRMLLAKNMGILLDHAGHLGGALCGWLAFTFGGPIFSSMRRALEGPKTGQASASQAVQNRKQ